MFNRTLSAVDFVAEKGGNGASCPVCTNPAPHPFAKGNNVGACQSRLEKTGRWFTAKIADLMPSISNNCRIIQVCHCGHYCSVGSMPDKTT